MIAARNDITQERLKYLFRYEPDTGHFIRLVKTARRTKIGDIAGTRHNKGYWFIMVDGVKYLAHRLAWLYTTGEWPNDQIDHIDLDKSNTRWLNLREANNSKNQGNKPVRSDSISGLKGAFKREGKWVSFISVNGVRHHIGTFASPHLANAAYEVKAIELFGEFARAI